MAESSEVRRADDLVRLKNKTMEAIRANFDGAVYAIPASEEIVIQRSIAEHIRKNTSISSPGGRSARLEIIELPASQRQKSPGEFPKMVDENNVLKAENTGLKERVRELVEENSSLQAQLKKKK